MLTNNSSKQVKDILVSRLNVRVDQMVKEVNEADKYYCWCSNYDAAISSLPKELEVMAEIIVKINQLKKFSKIAGAKNYNAYIEERVTRLLHELWLIAGSPLMGGVGLNPEFGDLI